MGWMWTRTLSWQVLKPHYDANQGASVEDKERGGQVHVLCALKACPAHARGRACINVDTTCMHQLQVLVTVLAYLNDVVEGGSTRFGKLDLNIQVLSAE